MWLGSKLHVFAKVPVVVLVLLICTAIAGLTELTSNAATATILLPILGSMAIGISQNPLLLMIPATLACSNAFMLPVATPPNAIVFASGKITMREMMLTGGLLNLIGIFLNTGWIFIYAPVWGIHFNHLPSWANTSEIHMPTNERLYPQ